MRITHKQNKHLILNTLIRVVITFTDLFVYSFIRDELYHGHVQSNIWHTVILIGRNRIDLTKVHFFGPVIAIQGR